MDLDSLGVPSIAAAISALVTGAGGQAGENAWQNLAALVRRTFGRGSPPDRIVSGEYDVGVVEALSRELASRAASDPTFADALRSWMSNVPSSEVGGGEVYNVIGGEAYVEGNVVQTRDVFGSITFGGPSIPR
jgi:hypothetical protein